MEHSQNRPLADKSSRLSIHPSHRLHITIDMQHEPTEPSWLPGMSVFSINGPPGEVPPRNLPRNTVSSPASASASAAMSTMATGHPPRPSIDLDRVVVYCSCHSRHRPSRFTPAGPEGNYASVNGFSGFPDCRGSHECFTAAMVVNHMRQSGSSEESIRTACLSPALMDYNSQLLLLERQNRKRLALSRAPLVGDTPPTTQDSFSMDSTMHDYYTQIMILEEENKKRLRAALAKGKTAMTRATSEFSHEDQTPKPEILSEANMAYERQFFDHFDPRESAPLTSEDRRSKSHTAPSHQLWLSGPHALQDYETQRRLVESTRNSQNQPAGNAALADYQMQLMLLEQQNKKRLVCRNPNFFPEEGEKLDAQRQAIVQRHQANMARWQSTRQRDNVKKNPQSNDPTGQVKCSTYSFAPCAGVGSNAARMASKPSQDAEQPAGRGSSEEKHTLNLPIRQSKSVAKRTEDPDLAEWDEVQPSRKRACSEESEQFAEEYDLLEFDSD